MSKVGEALHINGIHHRWNMFLVNHIFVGTNPKFFNIKRNLLQSIGYSIGENTKIVGPLECTGVLTIGKECWIRKNLKINGNGSVEIGDCCDIAPEVTFQTGGHEIGNATRRAGKGIVYNQSVESGTWIGGRTTILGETRIGRSCIVAGCACVIKDVPDCTLVGGVPAKQIRKLDC